MRSARDLVANAPAYPPRNPAIVLANPVMPPAPIPGASFPPLNAAAAEGRAVQALLPGSAFLTGAAADERTLLGAPAPRILHVATHAFFLSAGLARPEGGSGERGLALQTSGPSTPRAGMGAWDTKEAWMRTAVVLAQPQGAGPSDDGLATAYEIMASDLRGTELVTLSACETGRGELAVFHGVTSLQQAFLTAGARSVLASLWEVDDLSTSLWMKEFYRALAAGSSRVEAVGHAMDVVRSQYPHPFHWAPFSLFGAIGPLPGVAGAPQVRQP
jgi:CHAT domain-containing protein